MAISDQPRAHAAEEPAAQVRCIDSDIHNDLPSLGELKPFLASQWHPWLEGGGPGQPARYWANQGSGRMDDSVNEADGLCAGDPEWVIDKLMRKCRIDVGILTGSLRPGIQHNARLWSALVRAYNDWTLERWVRPYDYFKGSIFVAAQDPDAAAAEIDRLGDDPGMVQVLLSSASVMPLRAHFYLTSYPLEAAPDPADLARALRLIEAERTLLFSGNFPSWELGDPFDMVAPVPAAMRARVMGQNAVDLYGPRLLAPNS